MCPAVVPHLRANSARASSLPSSRRKVFKSMPALHQTVKSSSTPVGEYAVMHLGMADDAEIRRQNLRRLFPGDPFPSTRAARELGRTPAFWSDLARGRKSFGEKLARSIEEHAGLPRLALDDPANALCRNAHLPKGEPTSGGTHLGGESVENLSQLSAIVLPTTVEWETIAMGAIPERFVLAMPDDALAPQTPRGTKLIFVAGSEPPRYGVGVLVEDPMGARYVRRWVQGVAGGWVAEARNNAYRNLSSSDGAKVIAWVQARFDGDV